VDIEFYFTKCKCNNFLWSCNLSFYDCGMPSSG